MYRLLMLDGELVGAVRRDRAHVVGDGRSSVVELRRTPAARRQAALRGSRRC